jgi:regulator of protease activity HflC (stomatin/prohibitin superfamily)
MGEFGIVVVVLFVFVAVTIAKGVRIVPQGEEWIVERLGKYHATLRPGLNIIIPYLDQVRYKLTTKDIILDVQEQEVITKDNAVILTNAIAFIKVTDPIKAVYGVTDFSEAIRNMIMTTLRSIIGEMTLDEALSNRDKIKARLREGVADEAIDWGLTVKSVEIQDINPSESMQKAMEAQASAERERKAMVTKAEGTKQATILNAEAQLQAARLPPKRRLRWPRPRPRRSSASPWRSAAEDAPMRYMLGEKYINAIGNLAKSDNAKTVLIPADIQDTLRGILGSRK